MRGAEKPDILKVAHHGSKYSSSDDFLNSIAKQGSVAIISCGRKNTYGHPHKETLERLREAGCEIYRTDLQGAITIKVSNNENKVVPFCE